MADHLLEGKSAVVAGGSRGIGRAVALALAAHGASVVVNGRTAEPAEETVSSIRAAGGQAAARVGSVSDFEFARELIETCVAEFGGIDVLVNCAGIQEPANASILDMDAGDWQESIGTHLTGTFNTCRHAAARMVDQGKGAIVNTSSHAYQGSYGGTGYPAAKGGTNSLTFAIAAELREHGVRVNAVCPGARTRLSTGPAYERHIEKLHTRGLLGSMIRDASLAPAAPEHVAPLFVFLASEQSQGISGRLFSGSGGYVGLHDAPKERLLAFRDTAEGPWPLGPLSKGILKGMEST